MSSSDLAVVYAALILHDDGVEITAEKLNTLVKKAGVEIEPIWATIFAKALEGKNIADFIKNISAGAASAPAASAPAAAAAAPAGGKAEKKEEKKNLMMKWALDSLTKSRINRCILLKQFIHCRKGNLGYQSSTP
jgi:large subunit ribosomal protein LP1